MKSTVFLSEQGYPAFPREASWAECRSYVEHLPDQDLAQAFGMDNQAEAVVLHSQSQLLLHNILAMQPHLSDSSSLARWEPQRTRGYLSLRQWDRGVARYSGYLGLGLEIQRCCQEPWVFKVIEQHYI